MSDEQDPIAAVYDEDRAQAIRSIAEGLRKVPVFFLAALIEANWDEINDQAAVQVERLWAVTSLEATIGGNDGIAVAREFLARADSWQGELAQMVKSELLWRTQVH